MGSGIFTIQEFVNRGVIKIAPDVLVYINGSFGERMIAPVSSQEQVVQFNDGITSVSIQNTIDPPGQSTANITVATPIYGETSKYWIDVNDPDMKRTTKIPIFVPMMEVRIYLKGRFLSDGAPKYYPAFWGLINTVEENYSGGLYTINLNCVDMLHWWHWSTVNVHPVVTDYLSTGGTMELTPWSTIFKTGNPYIILYELTQLMGEYLFTPPVVYGQKTPHGEAFPSSSIVAVSRKIMSYWNKRLANTGNLLKMYGLSGREISVIATGDFKDRKYQMVQILPNGERKISPVTSKGELAGRDYGTKIYTYEADFLSNAYLTNLPVLSQLDKMGTWNESEYMTKLEIATHVKDRCEFEFFQDVNGNFIFKPPFYNMNMKYTMPYVIKPNDIINSSFQIDSEGIVTSMQVRTGFCYALLDKQYPSGIGYHIDMDLATKYGIRHRLQDAGWIASSGAANQLAMAYMALINAKCTTGSVTIPGRPEIRMGYPVYIDHRDSFHYVKAINHSFDYGGTFTTTLSLEAERTKQYDDKGQIYKNYVYLYKGPSSDPTSNIPDPWSATKAKLAQTKSFGIQQGRYELVPVETVLNTMNPAGENVEQKRDSLKSVTYTTVPFTDEEGYKVIGGMKYGRGLPYDFERSMFILDEGAGYERESVVMGLLHKHQERLKSTVTNTDQNTETTIANAGLANKAQATTSTTETAAINAGVSSEVAAAKAESQNNIPTPTSSAVTSGSNESTWTYEGVILSYLDEFQINKSGAFSDQGKTDISDTKVKESLNPPVKTNGKSSDKLVGNITADSQIDNSNKMASKSTGGQPDYLTVKAIAANSLSIRDQKVAINANIEQYDKIVEYYTNILNDPKSTPAQKDEAAQIINQVTASLQQSNNNLSFLEMAEKRL